MARPIKEGLDYFPLDVDIDTDDKIAIIEAMHGIEGFGIVIKLLMKIYKEGYFYEWSKREQILFSKRVNVDINLVNEVVNEAINEGLFNKTLYDQHNVLTSKGIQKRYLEAIKRRKEVSFLQKFYLIEDPKSIIGTSNMAVFVVDDNNNKVNVNINSINGDISTQRKGKERKEKERKEKHKGKVVVVENPHKFYQENFGVLSPFVGEDISHWSDDLNEDLVIAAMKIALQNNKPWKYATGVLKDWEKHNLKTLDDVEAYNKQRNGSKGNEGSFDLND